MTGFLSKGHKANNFFLLLKIRIITQVGQPFLKVFEQFDKSLLLKLSPPFPSVEIIAFGQAINDEVCFELSFFFTKQKWVSVITDKKILDESAFFIDEGVILPFFLKYWKHKHIVEKDELGSKIIDEIEFKTPSVLTDYFFYPLLYLQFLYRKPIYQKVFSPLNPKGGN